MENTTEHEKSLTETNPKTINVPSWKNFADHLVFHNRFTGSEEKENVCRFLDKIISENKLTYSIPKGAILYRGRKITEDEIRKSNGVNCGFDEKQSGVPPYRKTHNGRVNIAGIPVLYTAAEQYTACAELRPIKNEFVSIAQYEVAEDIVVADFVLDNIPSYEDTPEGMLFLKDMFSSFSLPVTNELIDYLPSQFVSEYIRIAHEDISGIRYSSLRHIGGYNIAIFDEEKCRFVRSTVLRCSRVQYEFKDIDADQILEL
ncbi:MAG: RES family NAD+ phosphorylase [Oscillospiraceae bacterium]|nr:RES family NAD+ phosphorylase [Oscillospiraceae bacterium]